MKVGGFIMEDFRLREGKLHYMYKRKEELFEIKKGIVNYLYTSTLLTSEIIQQVEEDVFIDYFGVRIYITFGYKYYNKNNEMLVSVEFFIKNRKTESDISNFTKIGNTYLIGRNSLYQLIDEQVKRIKDEFYIEPPAYTIYIELVNLLHDQIVLVN